MSNEKSTGVDKHREQLEVLRSYKPLVNELLRDELDALREVHIIAPGSEFLAEVRTIDGDMLSYLITSGFQDASEDKTVDDEAKVLEIDQNIESVMGRILPKLDDLKISYRLAIEVKSKYGLRLQHIYKTH